MSQFRNVGASWLLVATKGANLLAVLKSIKILKVLLSFVSMVASVITYGLTLGWGFGVGLVLMLFIHEMGHVIALRRKHLPASLPVFIPFLGAAIFAPDMGDRATEAYVGYGGPFIGSIAALACFGLWAALGGTSDLLLSISYLGVYLNLFNLLPISPLDGGRITQIVGDWFKYLGAALAIGLVVESGEAGMIFLLIVMLDGFPFGLFVRPLAALCLCLAMLGLFALGYSAESVWVQALDVWAGGLLLGFYVLSDWNRAKIELRNHDQIRQYALATAQDDALIARVFPPVPEGWLQRLRFARNNRRPVESEPKRPLPPVRTRIGWLAAYVSLAMVLAVTIVVQTGYLPVK